jgi:ProP effector
MQQEISHAKKNKLEVIDWLIEYFPNAFFRKPSQVRPLKIGVFDDILDFYARLDSPPFSKKSLREGLSYYSSSKAYLRCQTKDAARVDIYGNEVDVVSEEQAHYAHKKFQERYAAKKDEV